MGVPRPREIDVTIDEFNRLDAEEALRLLARCADVPSWAAGLVAGRPFDTRQALLDAARTTGERWSDDDVARALADHPKIGERPASTHLGAEHSSREQAAVQTATTSVKEAIAEGNARYEERFDRVFLVRAAGRSPEEILDLLTTRLEHDDDTERRVVARELLDITLLRLEEMVAS